MTKAALSKSNQELKSTRENRPCAGERAGSRAWLPAGATLLALTILGGSGVSADDVRPEIGAEFIALGHLPDRPGETFLPGVYASYVSGMSASGDVIVGTSLFNDERRQTFRWTKEGGLAPLDGGIAGISADGKTIALWQTGGLVLLREGNVRKVIVESTLNVSLGAPVLNDGTLFGSCYPSPSSPGPAACRLDGVTGELSFLPAATRILAADEVGNVAGVRSGGTLETHYLTMATLNDQLLYWPRGAYCPFVNSCESAVRAFSAGAEVAVGTARVPLETSPGVPGPSVEVAFSKAAKGPMTMLEDLPGGQRAAGAEAISADGKVIGGHGSDADGRQAVVWLHGVPRKLSELVHEAG